MHLIAFPRSYCFKTLANFIVYMHSSVVFACMQVAPWKLCIYRIWGKTKMVKNVILRQTNKGCHEKLSMLDCKNLYILVHTCTYAAYPAGNFLVKICWFSESYYYIRIYKMVITKCTYNVFELIINKILSSFF